MEAPELITPKLAGPRGDNLKREPNEEGLDEFCRFPMIQMFAFSREAHPKISARPHQYAHEERGNGSQAQYFRNLQLFREKLLAHYGSSVTEDLLLRISDRLLAMDLAIRELPNGESYPLHTTAMPVGTSGRQAALGSVQGKAQPRANEQTVWSQRLGEGINETGERTHSSQRRLDRPWDVQQGPPIRHRPEVNERVFRSCGENDYRIRLLYDGYPDMGGRLLYDGYPEMGGRLLYDG